MTGLELLGAATIVAPAAVVAIRVPRSEPRWSLAVALTLAIPVVGAVLAAIALKTRGENHIERDLEPAPEPCARVEPSDIERIGGLPPLLDRLMSADPAVRLCALETIRRRPDREMVEMLRWAISHGEPDSVLDAALTFEEIELKWRSNLDAAVDELGNAPRFSTAVRAADLAIEGITNGLVDDAVVVDLADQARERYEAAAAFDPTRDVELGARRARLELVAGEPVVAFEVLESLRVGCQTWTAELRALQARARFAVRRAPSRRIDRAVFALP